MMEELEPECEYGGSDAIEKLRTISSPGSPSPDSSEPDGLHRSEPDRVRDADVRERDATDAVDRRPMLAPTVTDLVGSPIENGSI